jgi:hypothetical protein
MPHPRFTLIVPVLTTCILAVSLSPALAAERHAGTIVSVDVQKRTLLVEELGAAARVEQLHLWIGPETRLLRSEVLPAAEVTDATYPFRDTPIDSRISGPVISWSSSSRTAESGPL